MKGYKGMNNDMTCRLFKFEIGKTYHAEGDICLCKNGFHFCKNLCNVFHYYPEGRYFEIEASGDILSEGNKSVCSVIKIIRELTSTELHRYKYGYGFGGGYSDDYGDGYGDGDKYGCGNGYGNGDGYNDGDGYGDGHGYGDGYGRGYGDGYGDGEGDGYTDLNGYFLKIGIYM